MKIGLFFLITIVALGAWVVFTKPDQSQGTTISQSKKPAKPPIVIGEDAKHLGEFIHFPTPPLHVRSLEVAMGETSLFSVGPTDTHLCALVEVDAAAWPIWEKGFGLPLKAPPYDMNAEIAEALFPPALLKTLKHDSDGYRIEPPYYDPTPYASSWYSGIVAARIGNYVLMEFGSH